MSHRALLCVCVYTHVSLGEQGHAVKGAWLCVLSFHRVKFPSCFIRPTFLPSRRSLSARLSVCPSVRPPSSLAHSNQYYLSQQCVSLFHLPILFDVKANAATFAFSVSLVPFSLLPLCWSPQRHMCMFQHTREGFSFALCSLPRARQHQSGSHVEGKACLSRSLSGIKPRRAASTLAVALIPADFSFPVLPGC